MNQIRFSTDVVAGSTGAGAGTLAAIDNVYVALNACEPFELDEAQLGEALPEVMPVSIDIKPGSFPNSINPKSGGRIPVAVLSAAGFDAPLEVYVSSLTFGRTGTEQSLAFCNSRPEDVNGDGFVDLICHFDTRLTGFQSGDTEGTLNGRTVSGTPLTGTDSVRIVAK